MGWKPEPIWAGETVFIICGGPSVAFEDLSLLKGRRVIVINSSFTAYPNADYLIFADIRWWKHNEKKVRSDFMGKIVSVSRMANGPGIHNLNRVKPNKENGGLSTDPAGVTIERTTTQSAINLAIHLGASRIVLIGADMGRDVDGKTHHHDPHPWRNKDGNKTWDVQLSHLRSIAPTIGKLGIEVLNTSQTSRIDWWLKVPLHRAVRLPDRRRNAVGTPNSQEYRQLVRRNFKPYSMGHRKMYLIPLEFHFGVGQHRIFEAGFGIGWGLDQMVARNNVARYVGCEPNKESFDWTQGRHKDSRGVSLLNEPFTTELADKYAGGFDHAFCIEVIEHVPNELHLEFLKNLRKMAPKLWFSTPDIRVNPKEGVRTKEDWVALLKEAGFSNVEVTTKHWTYLYECS
jgi:2-polyprenyl-3-methyl-5-hydroxy-6-metoxy-1,4-benzoquinol methylase